MKILELLIFVSAAVILFKLLSYFTKRIRAIVKICGLKKECGAEVRLMRSPLAILLHSSPLPDIAVSIGEQVYLLRLINGRGGAKHLHFASRRYYVTFSEMKITLGALLNVGKKYKVTKGAGYQTTSSHSVKILGELAVPDEFKGKTVTPVLLLSPAPAEVTYVTEERTSIKAAFEGDDVYGQRIFTASTFFNHADRVKRELDSPTAERAIFRE